MQPEQPKPELTSDADIADCVPILQHLFRVGQTLCDQTQGVVDRLSQEVLVATHARALFISRDQHAADEAPVPPAAVAVSFPIQFRDQMYGTPAVVTDPGEPTRPALPLAPAHLLAQACGWLLYTCEAGALQQSLLSASKQQVPAPLTRREHDVLVLICRGYNQKEITRKLSISRATLAKHRQHIYEKLGVHNERDAAVAAYLSGLFPPLEDISASSTTGP
ncbi:MAG TPA: helix-turn-helix transcriptional regulator [Ktedonobacteraceae bacterium]|nr:helix-turn-helix transcriptional regulator [Ktedonobacteraceae bacterium]